MIKVINNADDFGYSNGINYGIIDSYQQGVLTSTTLMAGMPGFDHAVVLAKENPGLAIGVHLTLTCGKPILKTHKTIVDEKGYFKKRDFYLQADTTIDEQEVYQEWKAQIEKVLASGITPSHLDSHHHSHTFKNNQEIVMQLAKEYQLPVRNSFTSRKKEKGEEIDFTVPDPGRIIFNENGIATNDILLDPWLKDSLEAHRQDPEAIVDAIIAYIEANKHLDVIEVMWHPAYIDQAIMTGSSFNLPRIYETAALLNSRLKEYLETHCVLCTYRDI